MSSNLAHGEVYSIQNYVIKFVSDLRQVGGFLSVLWFPPPTKRDRQDITETLLQVALSTITRILILCNMLPLNTCVFEFLRWTLSTLFIIFPKSQILIPQILLLVSSKYKKKVSLKKADLSHPWDNNDTCKHSLSLTDTSWSGRNMYINLIFM